MAEYNYLYCHLEDLRETICLFKKLNIKLCLPVFLRKSKLYIGENIVSNFSHVLQFSELLISKFKEDEARENFDFFRSSVYRIEHILASSLFNSDSSNLSKIYTHIFSIFCQSIEFSRFDHRMAHRYNLIHYLIMYALQTDENSRTLINHKRSLQKIYILMPSYSSLVLLFVFKLSCKSFSEKDQLLRCFENYHKFICDNSHHISLPALEGKFEYANSLSLYVFSAKDIFLFEKEFRIKNSSRFGYLVNSCNDSRIYPLHPDNILNNTHLPFHQIFFEAIYFGFYRSSKRIYFHPGSNISVNPNLTDQDIKSTPHIANNSYFMAFTNNNNWFHFLIECILPLYQIISSGKISLRNIIVPSHIYDVDNELQLVQILANLNPNCRLKVLKLQNNLSVENLFWCSRNSKINNQDCTGANSAKAEFLSVKLINNFTEAVKSSIAIDTSLSFKKIYLKRSTSLKRECQNLLEVEDLLLERFKLKSVELERYTFCQQVSILHNCDFVVGPTGAAWTNIIFCNRLKNVQAICWGLDIQYKYLWQTLAHSANINLRQMYTDDVDSYSVDCNVLAEYITSLIGPLG